MKQGFTSFEKEDGTFILTLTEEAADLLYDLTDGNIGSYTVIIPRLLGTTYANALRILRDMYRAHIYNFKNNKYYYNIIFDNHDSLRSAQAELNKRWTIFLREKGID